MGSFFTKAERYRSKEYNLYLRFRYGLLYNTEKQEDSTEGSCYDKYHYPDI
jgi:hypothetical protein